MQNGLEGVQRAISNIYKWLLTQDFFFQYLFVLDRKETEHQKQHYYIAFRPFFIKKNLVNIYVEK